MKASGGGGGQLPARAAGRRAGSARRRQQAGRLPGEGTGTPAGSPRPGQRCTQRKCAPVSDTVASSSASGGAPGGSGGRGACCCCCWLACCWLAPLLLLLLGGGPGAAAAASARTGVTEARLLGPRCIRCLWRAETAMPSGGRRPRPPRPPSPAVGAWTCPKLAISRLCTPPGPCLCCGSLGGCLGALDRPFGGVGSRWQQQRYSLCIAARAVGKNAPDALPRHPEPSSFNLQTVHLQAQRP